MTTDKAGRLAVQAPLPAPPVLSLLTAADIVPPDPDTAERWLNGIRYEPETANTDGAPAAVVVPVQCAAQDPLAAYDNVATQATDPFLVYAQDKCSTFGWQAHDYVARARRALDVAEAWAVEREFWTGAAAQAAATADDYLPTSQWLANATTSTTVVSTARAAVRFMSEMQDALADQRGGARAVFHAPRSAAPTLVNAWQVRRDGNRWLTPTDDIVVFGSGYPGTSPAGADPTAGTAWVYVTGPVRIWRTDVEVTPGTIAEATNRSTNTVEFRAQRYYLVDWDRQVHLAGLLSLY